MIMCYLVEPEPKRSYATGIEGEDGGVNRRRRRVPARPTR